MIDNNELNGLIKGAVCKSLEKWEEDCRDGDKSEPFVQELAVQLESIAKLMEPHSLVVGLARGHNKDQHRDWFGLTEMLWDVAVLRVEPFVPGTKERRRVLGGIWAVESELVNDFTGVLVDANKLMLARVDQRLLVARESQITKYAHELSMWCRKVGVQLWVAAVDYPQSRTNDRVDIAILPEVTGDD